MSVSVLCSGPVYTKPEIESETKKKLGWLGNQMAVSPKRDGEIAVKKNLKKRLMIIPGNLNKVLSVVIRILPRRGVVALYGNLGEYIYGIKIYPEDNIIKLC